MTDRKKMNIFQKQNAPSRRTFLYGMGALAATSSLQMGCSTTASSSAKSPGGTTTQPTPSGIIDTATATVTSTTLGNFGSQFLGFSYEKKDMNQYHTLSANATNMIALFKLLGIGVLRIGGTTVDETVWSPTGSGLKSGYIAPTDVDAVASFVNATGWKVIYGVNLGGMNPALSAQEAAYAVSVFGSNLLGIEIGNEPDLFKNNIASMPNAPTTIPSWLTAFEAATDAILAISPSAPIIGPAVAGYIGGYLPPFATAVGANSVKNLSQYTMHYYRNVSATIPNMLSYPDSYLTGCLSQILGYTAPTGLPFRLGECNSFAGGGTAGVSNSCASSLWAIEMLFSAAIGGASGVNFHTGYESTSYTPITFGSSDALGVAPEYYGMLFASLAGTGTLKQITTSTPVSNVAAFAIATSSGGLNVVIVNPDASNNLNVTLAAGQTINKASLIAMNNPSLSATPLVSGGAGTTIQGSSVALNGKFTPASSYTLSSSGSNVSFYVPAMSAVLVKLT